MKEATGELSMTAIVVVIIGVIAVAAPPIIRGVINSTGNKAKCVAAYGCTTSDENPTANSKFECTYAMEENADGSLKEQTITCSGKDLGYE